MVSIFKKHDMVISEFKQKWGNRYDYSKVEYYGTNTKVKIICRLHGEFELYPWQHKKKAGCSACGRISASRKISKKLRCSTSEFIEKAKEKWGDMYDYSKVSYRQSFVPVTIVCSTHGDFEITPAAHLEYKGCTSCCSQKSFKETKWLNSIGLPNDQIHRNINLNLEGKCLVDGYNPSTNTVYEFHGDFWHGNPKIYNSDDTHPMIGKTFGELYRTTIEKEEKIKSAGFNLITMWESDFN